MKQLKNCIKLNSNVKIYVPSTSNVDEQIDSSQKVLETLTFLSEKFGGSTATKAMGAWITQKGSLVTENVTMVLSYCNQNDLTNSIEDIYQYCVKMKLDMKQESIALEVNGEMYLV